MLNLLKNYKINRIAKKVTKKLVNHLNRISDFDLITAHIEKHNDISFNSVAYQNLVRDNFDIVVNVKTEHDIKNTFLIFGDSSINNENRIVTVKFARKEDENLHRRAIMIGCVINNEKIWFPNQFCHEMFSYFEPNGFLYSENDKPIAKYDYVSYTVYDSITDEYYYFISIGLHHKDNSLKMYDKGQSIPYERNPYLNIKIPIKNKPFSNEAIAYIILNKKILKTKIFELNDKHDFTKLVNRMLFPYNLSSEIKKELEFEDIDLNRISENFDELFEVYNMFKI